MLHISIIWQALKRKLPGWLFLNKNWNKCQKILLKLWIIKKLFPWKYSKHYNILNKTSKVSHILLFATHYLYYFKLLSVCRSWPWSDGSWIYNYLCNQCLSPLMLWVWISIRARCTTLCDKVCQWLATDQWFSSGPPVFSTNKTDHQI